MRDVHGEWQPALVTAVASFTSDSVPAGSLTVCRQGDAQSCTILPEMFGKMVRKPVNGMGRKSTDGSAKDDLDKEQWNPDTYLQQNPDKDDGLVGKVSSTTSSCKLDDSAVTRCQSNQDEIQRSPSSPSSTSRSRADPPDTAAVSPPVVSKTPSDGTPGSNAGAAKTSADADEETSGVSKSDIQVVRADSGDKQEDSMSKSPSDGTTASGHTPRPSVTATPMSASPCASPASCPQPAPRHTNFLDLDERPPSPAGSVHSVHPTVSLRIPDLDDRPQSRPNSPCTTPRQFARATWMARDCCGLRFIVFTLTAPFRLAQTLVWRKATTCSGICILQKLLAVQNSNFKVASTVEGPTYNRAEQRVLVVGAGFGRELNPQQGR